MVLGNLPAKLLLRHHSLNRIYHDTALKNWSYRLPDDLLLRNHFSQGLVLRTLPVGLLLGLTIYNSSKLVSLINHPNTRLDIIHQSSMGLGHSIWVLKSYKRGWNCPGWLWGCQGCDNRLLDNAYKGSRSLVSMLALVVCCPRPSQDPRVMKVGASRGWQSLSLVGVWQSTHQMPFLHQKHRCNIHEMKTSTTSLAC